MFDLGWPELMLIMLVALVVIGPKELPNAIRTVMGIVRKLRGAAREFQSGLDDIAKETGLHDMKRDLENDLDYYDPGEALKSIAESDKDILDLDDDPFAAGNSILDHANKPEEPKVEDEPVSDKAAADTDKVETASAPEEIEPDQTETDRPKTSGDATS